MLSATDLKDCGRTMTRALENIFPGFFVYVSSGLF